MLATSDAFTLTVEGVEQVASAKVEIDLPGGVYPDVTLTVSDLSIEQSTTTDQPDNTRYVSGVPSTTAELTLSGTLDPDDETVTAASVFNPYQTSSPLYRASIRGSSVRIYLGLLDPDGTAETLRKFTGYVDSFNLDPVSGDVTFKCVDRRNDLRSSVDVPAVVTAAPFNAGLTSEFAVDALLRAATAGAVSSWPAQRADCILAVGLRSSLWPEVGALETSLDQPSPVFTAGPFGTGLTHVTAAGGFASVILRNADAITTSIYLEALVSEVTNGVEVSLGALSGAALAAGGCDFEVTPSALAFATTGGSATWSVAVDTAPHKVAVAVTFTGSTYAATFWLDGTSHTVTGVSFTSDPTTWTHTQIASDGADVVAGVQVTTETAPTATAFAAQLVMDPSLNNLTVIPEISGDPWQAIQQIADAEQAVAGWDQAADVFRFRNRQTLRTGTSVRDITSTESLLALQIGVDGAGYANQVQVPYTEWNVGTAATVWSLDAPLKVPASRTIYQYVSTDGLVAGVDATVSALPDSGVVTGSSYYRSSVDRYGTAEGPQLNIRIFQTAANKLTIRIQNPSGQDAWLVSSSAHIDLAAGTPVLQVGGLNVTPGDEQTVTSTTGDGLTTYQAQSNPWIQNETTAQGIADDLLSTLAVERPNLTGIDIVPDPRLELADRVHIVDPIVTGLDDYAVIFGQTLSLSAGDDGTVDYTHTIDARAVSKPGGWILGVPGRSELGVSTLI